MSLHTHKHYVHVHKYALMYTENWCVQDLWIQMCTHTHRHTHDISSSSVAEHSWVPKASSELSLRPQGLCLLPEARFLPSFPKSLQLLGGHYSLLRFPGILRFRPAGGAEAWAGGRPPLPSRPQPPLPAQLHHFGACGWLAGGLSRAGLFPLGSPAAHIPFTVPRMCQAACRLDVLSVLLASPSRRGPWGCSGLPEPLYWSRPSRRRREQRFPGESGFSAGLAPVPLCLAWQRLAWPV